MSEKTTVSVLISEGVNDSYSLGWELVDDDNNDPTCYLVGTEYKIRLHKEPSDIDPCVFANNGSIYFDEIVTEQITEEIIFAGEQIQSLSSPFISGLTYEQSGEVYGGSCVIFPAVSFTVNVGSKEIIASVPCYAVLSVTYTTNYHKIGRAHV